jgi:hypothetical protein
MLIRLAALGALGYAGYRLASDRRERRRAAYAAGEPDGPFRHAGSEATATPGDPMDKHDEALDETYPASDATAKY